MNAYLKNLVSILVDPAQYRKAISAFVAGAATSGAASLVDGYQAHDIALAVGAGLAAFALVFQTPND